MTGEHSDTPDDAGRWLPVADAAPVLGTTERTVRRRVLAGHVRSRQRDGRTEVWVSGRVPDDGPDVDATPDTPPEDARNRALVALERLLRDTLAEKDAVQQAAAMWQERSANLRAEVDRLQGEVEALLALPAHEEPPPPWWRRWRR
jgi:hypothetical protein